MKSKSFIISDTHFYHTNIVTFTDKDTGKKVRDFDSVQEMNDAIVNNCNSVVSPDDKLYILGDVAFGIRHGKKADYSNLEILSRINGKKVLIGGNHDYIPNDILAKYFYRVLGCLEHNDLIFSHIPIHKDSVNRWYCNVHGHLHTKIVLNADNTPDSDYISVCCEQPHINYTPIELSYLRSLIDKNKERYHN